MKGTDVIIFIILFAGLGVAGYFLYLNFPTSPVQLVDMDGNSGGQLLDIDLNKNFSQSQQFYPNMRFKDNLIRYYIEPSCGQGKKEQVMDAFDIVTEKTVLSFKSGDKENSEIFVTCSELAPDPDIEGHFIAGEGGPTKVINTSLYSVILEGKISLFRPEKCEMPNIAIHEILHVLGFDHNEDPGSILYPTLDCDQKIDSYFVERINKIYSVSSAAELEVSEVEATKLGPYLNFEARVINQGLQDVDSASLKIYANDKFIKSFELNEIEIGTTKILTVENLKISRFTDEVKFVVDEENKVIEIFEDNNEKVLGFSGN